MVPAVLIYWAVFKSGEMQRSTARWRAVRPAVRHRAWVTLLVVAVVGTALGAAVAWAFSTSHAAIGVAALLGFLVLDGVVMPILRARRMRTKAQSRTIETTHDLS